MVHLGKRYNAVASNWYVALTALPVTVCCRRAGEEPQLQLPEGQPHGRFHAGP